MISHKHKCIFIHIPKCAGTSIESALGHFDNHEGRGGQDHRSIRMIEKPYMTRKALSSKENLIEIIKRQKHQYIDDVGNKENKSTLTKDQYRDYFKFAIVRNPWARAFSWYKNVMVDKIHRANHEITEETSFNDFLGQFAGQGMLKPQTYWLKNFDGSVSLDYIGRFENLSNEIIEISNRLNLTGMSLPHKVKGRKADYREHYDDETYKIILDVYADEIELFNYQFDTDVEQPNGYASSNKSTDTDSLVTPQLAEVHY